MSESVRAEPVAAEEVAAPASQAAEAAPSFVMPGPGRTPARGPRGAWSPAQVAALQRSAGNAAVAGLLAGRAAKVLARGTIQRELKTTAADIETGVGPKSLRAHLALLQDNLKVYHRAHRSEERTSLLKMMHRNISDWLAAYETSGKATGAGSRVKLKLTLFKHEVEQELPEAALQSEYVEHMRLGRFEYTSFESQGQVREAEKLIRGETGVELKGMGPAALKLVRDQRLSEAEVLAIKVYSVGDYRAINATLGLYDDSRLTAGLQEMGLVKDPNRMPVLPPEGLRPTDPTKAQEWDKQKQRFDQFAPSFKPDLAKVKAEAQRHAAILYSAFRKMPVFDSKGKGGTNTWRGVRLDPSWSDFTSYTTQHSVITVKNFVSTSKDRGQAERFAIKKANDGRKGLMLECVLKNGRDISMLSEHGKEKEVLLLPGARLEVMQVVPAHSSLPYDYHVKVEEK